MMKNKEKILNWYHSETEKDSVELEKTKNNIINSIKKVDKTKIYRWEKGEWDNVDSFLEV